MTGPHLQPVSGVILATDAIAGPPLGNLVDRHGQRTLLRWFGVDIGGREFTTLAAGATRQAARDERLS